MRLMPPPQMYLHIVVHKTCVDQVTSRRHSLYNLHKGEKACALHSDNNNAATDTSNLT